MKKLLAIIAILLVILIGMIINQNIQKQNQSVSIEEVSEIEKYIQKIYLWKEVTNQALPPFENINQANETWIWEVVKKNLEEYEIDKEKIQEKAKELFGQDFSKKYPEEGTSSFDYDTELQRYYPTEVSIDQKEDLFLLDTIKEINDGYEVEIIEYLEDYTNAVEGKVEIKNTKEEMIASIDSNQVDELAIDLVKENKSRFSKKKVFLKKQEENIYVIRIEEYKE